MFVSTDAIILKNTPYQDSSIISRLFTREEGKLSTIFKGAKKSKNNLPGIIEPGNIINITFYNKSNLKIAKETKLIQTYYSNRKILSNYYYTMAIISLLDKLCMEHQQYIDLYDLTIDVLFKIDEQKINIDILFIYFLIHLNRTIGYEINIIDNINTDKNKKLYNNDTCDIIKQLSQNIDVLYNIDADTTRKIDLINKLKIIIYRHMREHIIDLNEINAIQMLKYINNESTSR